MQSFPASDLQRNPAEIQRAALMQPVFLTYHDKPRYVMMSLEEFVRIQGDNIARQLAAYPQAVAARVRDLAGSPPEATARAVDDLVLATVNAPYRRSIDAETLASCLATRDFEPWLVHVATFFTDVAPELVFQFADRHAISRASLAKAYSAIRKRTGERNPKLEAGLVSVAAPSRPHRRRARASSRAGKRNA